MNYAFLLVGVGSLIEIIFPHGSAYILINTWRVSDRWQLPWKHFFPLTEVRWLACALNI